MWLSTALILGMVLSTHYPVSAASASTVNVQYESRFMSDHPEWTPDVRIENGRVLLPLRDLASLLQLSVQWDQERKTATLVQPGRELKLSTRTNEVVSDGRVRKLDVPLTIRKQRIYVPVRFVAEWFDGEAVWDAKTRTVLIKDNSPFISASLGREMYWCDHLNGALYRSIGARMPVRLGSFKVPAGSGTEPAFSTITVEQATDSNRRLNIHLTVHGAGLGEGTHVLHGLFLKDGQILHHAELEYSGIYPFRHTDRYGGNAILSDGSLVRLVDPEGNIVTTHDLQALTGIEDRLMVERLTDRYILARPFKTPYLVLIDLVRQESFKLYQLFYSEEEQAVFENVGYWSSEFFHYFDLQLEKEEDGTLYFISRSIESGETRTYTYTIGQ